MRTWKSIRMDAAIRDLLRAIFEGMPFDPACEAAARKYHVSKDELTALVEAADTEEVELVA